MGAASVEEGRRSRRLDSADAVVTLEHDKSSRAIMNKIFRKTMIPLFRHHIYFAGFFELLPKYSRKQLLRYHFRLFQATTVQLTPSSRYFRMAYALEDDQALDGVELQIGEEGKSFLKQNLDALTDDAALSFLREFRLKHSLRRRGINPVLSLLEMGGVTLHAAHLEVLKVITDELLRLIAVAGDTNDKERIANLFGPTFRFLTVDQLRPVAVAVLERTDESIVGTEHWQQIVEAGLDSKPYVDLPMTLKRRIWELHSEVFEYEVDLILQEVREYVLPPEMTEIMDAKFYARTHDYAVQISQLVDLTNNGSTRATDVIAERFLEAARKELVDGRRVGLANLYQEYFSHPQIVSRSEVSPMTKRISTAARLLSARASDESAAPLHPHEVRLFKSWVTGESDAYASIIEPLALLLHSHQARDLFANQLTMTLFSYRGVLTRDGFLSHSSIKDLTILLMTVIKAEDVLHSGKHVTNEDIAMIFDTFYPVLLHEMRLDQEWQSNAYDTCVSLPDERIREGLRQGAFQRRVLCTYVYILFSINFLIGVSRFRLELDAVYTFAGEGAEDRERILAKNLILVGCEDT